MHPCWTRLAKEMEETGQFDMERLSPRLLARCFYECRAVMEGNEVDRRGVPRDIYAYLALLPSDDPDWYEVALAYVREKYQGNGVGDALMSKLLTKKKRGVQLFTISRNPTYCLLAVRHGFWAVTRLTVQYDVEAWAKKVGLIGEGKRNRLPEAALRHGLPRRVGEARRLFIR